MSLSELFEKDQALLRSRLEKEKTLTGCEKLIDDEINRLLMAYGESDAGEAERRMLSMNMETARSLIQLLSSQGEETVYETSGEKKKEVKHGKLWLPLLAVGLVLAGVSAVVMLLMGKDRNGSVFAILALVSAAAMYLSGRMEKVPLRKKDDPRYHIEVSGNAERICRILKTMCMVIDKNLAETASREKARNEKKETAVLAESGKQNEIRFLSDLLEAACADDSGFARTIASRTGYELHQQGIDVVNYSRDTRNLFDLMPGEKEATLRPALVRSGKLLRKGLASGGR